MAAPAAKQYQIYTQALVKPDRTIYRITFFEGKRWPRKHETQRHRVASFMVTAPLEGEKLQSFAASDNEYARMLDSNLAHFRYIDPNATPSEAIAKPVGRGMMYEWTRWGLVFLESSPPKPGSACKRDTTMPLNDGQTTEIEFYTKSGEFGIGDSDDE